MDEFSGVKNYWKAYEKSDKRGKLGLLVGTYHSQGVATRSIKEILMKGSFVQKRDRLALELIKGFDTILQYKNDEAEELRKEIEELKCLKK